MEYFDGKKIRDQIIDELKSEVCLMDVKPKLAVIWVGDDYATGKYIEVKKKAAEKIGVDFDLIKYPKEVAQTEIEEKIEELNRDPSVDGIMIQIPLPEQINQSELISQIGPEKDVDALRFCLNLKSDFYPPVTVAILDALKRAEVDMEKSKITVVGKGFLVGAPLISILEKLNYDLSVGDKDTASLVDITQKADVVISATGKGNIIQPNMVKEGVVLVDAGTSEVGGRLTGDIDPASYSKAKYYTPTPGGIGPVTVVMLLYNVVEAAKRNRS